MHFAEGLRYQPFADDAEFDLYEIVVGPLNAGLFPETDLDSTFAPEMLFYYSSESEWVTLLHLLCFDSFCFSPGLALCPGG